MNFAARIQYIEGAYIAGAVSGKCEEIVEIKAEEFQVKV